MQNPKNFVIKLIITKIRQCSKVSICTIRRKLVDVLSKFWFDKNGIYES